MHVHAPRYLAGLLLAAAAADPGASWASTESAAQAPAASATADPEDVFRKIFGREPPPLPNARYPVIINGMNYTAVEVTFDAKRQQRCKADQLLEILLPLLTDDAGANLQATLAGKPEINVSDMEGAGLSARFDARSLALHIDIPAASQAPIPITMRSRRQPAAENVLPMSPFSAYLTGSLSTTYVHEGLLTGSGWDRLTGRFLSAANWNGIVLEAAFDLDFLEDRVFQRGDTRISYDDMETAVRYEGLDLSTPTTGFQSGTELFGISAYRHFEITPYQVVQPISTRRFTLDRPAQVQIYINGLLDREYRLRAGQYDLRDIPFASAGANQLELRITYEDGTTETLIFPGFFDIDLLAPGISEFAFNLGFPERFSGEERDYEWDDPTFSGYFRQGITEWLTLGANIQANPDDAILGAEILVATPVGTLGLLGATTDPGKASHSTAEAFYTLTTPTLVGETIFDAAVRYTGREFQTLGATLGTNDVPDNEESWQGRARLGLDLTPSTRFQVAGAYDFIRSGEDSYSYGATLRQNFGFATFGVGAERRVDRGVREDVVRASISFPLGGGTMIGLYDSQDSTGRVQYGKSSGYGVGNYAYSIGFARGDETQQAYGEVQYEANRFATRLTHTRLRTLEGESSSQVYTQASVGAALAFSDGSFALSRPIYDSFAIVSPAASVADYRIAVDPSGRVFGAQAPDYVAFSDALGPAVIPDIKSYLVRFLEVHAPDAPAGISIGNNVLAVQPRYRSGYNLRVGNDANVTIIGTLLDQHGAPVALKAGEATAPGVDAPITFFTNSSGRFYLPGLKAGQAYTLTIPDQSMSAVLDVGEDAVGLIRQNDLRLTSRQEGKRS